MSAGTVTGTSTGTTLLRARSGVAPSTPRLMLVPAETRVAGTRVAGTRAAGTRVAGTRVAEWPDDASELFSTRSVGSSLRLTRRGRLVLGSLLLMVAIAVFTLGRASAGAAVVPGNHTVTVNSGDTLWSVAARAEPNGDPRVEVAALETVNHLSPGAPLEPGQILFLPQAG